jgi:transposase
MEPHDRTLVEPLLRFSVKTLEIRRPPAALHLWLKIADVQDGLIPCVTIEEFVELLDAKKRIRLLEQEDEVMRRAVAYLSRDIYPK